MIIQEKEWSACECCGARGKIIKEERVGCDNCGNDITDLLYGAVQNKYAETLQLTVFYKRGIDSAKHLHFCSWKCLFKKLPNIIKEEGFDFLNLPYLSNDKDSNKALELQGSDAFFKLFNSEEPQ